MTWCRFSTAIGECAIAWDERADGVVITRVWLPGPMRDAEPTESAQAVPAVVTQAIASINALLRGDRVRLLDVAIDLEAVPEFDRRVYEVTRRIGPGETRTYGDVATELGDPTLARAVGQALGRNPFPIVIPCHRVLAADGAMRGFSAPGGTDTKRTLLAIEGALLF